METRVCLLVTLVSLLSAIRQKHAPIIFQSTLSQAAVQMSGLHDIVIDPMKSSRGLLGYMYIGETDP